jgi:hypothetical protein
MRIVLSCAECSRQSDEKASWEAHLGANEIPEHEPPKRVLAFIFCPDCAERGFERSRSIA